MDIKDLIKSEKSHLERLQELVNKAIEEEQLLSRKLLEAEHDDQITFSQRLADKVASFGGSWTFIIFFFFAITFWIALNTLYTATDPYPFILLNLILSCVAALQAPIIMMSQNRQEEKDRQRARSDYLINLKAEIEVRNLHGKIDLLITEQMTSLFEIQKTQLDLLIKLQQSNSGKNVFVK